MKMSQELTNALAEMITNEAARRVAEHMFSPYDADYEYKHLSEGDAAEAEAAFLILGLAKDHNLDQDELDAVRKACGGLETIGVLQVS
jgi:hypothetical protein